MSVLRILKTVRRRLYGLRALVPGLRRKHQLETMVGPVGYWDELQAYQLGTLQRLGLRPEHTLLDIGCGPLQGGEPFIRYLQPQGYAGVDRRVEVIDVAYERIAETRLGEKNPLLLCSASFGDAELDARTFDFMWASQVLYYFHEADMRRLFDLIRRRLKPGGVFAGDILGPQSDRSFLKPPLPPAHTPESLDPVAREHGLQVTSLGTIRDFGYPSRLGLRTNVLLKIVLRG